MSIDQLQLLGLPVSTGAPIDPAQPPLVTGIHLRWMFASERGFPMFGYYLFRAQVGTGWEEVPHFPYPLALPVADPAYSCPGAPPDLAAAMAMARTRVKYGDADHAVHEFAKLHETLVTLVSQRTNGGMNAISSNVGELPSSVEQRPLDLLRLGALHPAVAQMLGLYFIDESALIGVSYRYLLLADHAGELGLPTLAGTTPAQRALEWVRHYLSTAESFLVDDAETHYLRWLGDAENAPPANVRAYVLPSSPVGRSDLPPPAGLTWDEQPDGDEEQAPNAMRSVLFHIRRSFHPHDPGPFPSDPFQWDLITENKPLLRVSRRAGYGALEARSPQWPPFELNATDEPGVEGWYAYCVTGVDLFGRFTNPSAPAQWWRWWPPPDPPPWYYEGATGEGVQNPDAIALLDKTPPPAPRIEAATLDPKDPWLVRDPQIEEFFAQQPDRVGIRLRWHWTDLQHDQAPDTAEFRIYWRPGRIESTEDIEALRSHVRGASACT